MPPPRDLLILKSVWESHVTCGTPVQSFVFLGLLVFELEPMYATSDRQTDGQTTDADDRLMPPRRGHNNLPMQQCIVQKWSHRPTCIFHIPFFENRRKICQRWRPKKSVSALKLNCSSFRLRGVLLNRKV